MPIPRSAIIDLLLVAHAYRARLTGLRQALQGLAQRSPSTEADAIVATTAQMLLDRLAAHSADGIGAGIEDDDNALHFTESAIGGSQPQLLSLGLAEQMFQQHLIVNRLRGGRARGATRAPGHRARPTPSKTPAKHKAQRTEPNFATGPGQIDQFVDLEDLAAEEP